MLYMIAHSLSSCAHGLLPVAISRITQPRDQMSTAPGLPGFSPLITSGDIYIGVPVMDRFGIVACFSPASVRPCRAITLAAPKSTYLMIPLWSSRISATLLVSAHLGVQDTPLTFGLDVSVGNAALMQIDKTLEQLKRIYHDDLLVFDSTMFQETGQRSSRTKLHENVHSVSMHFD